MNPRFLAHISDLHLGSSRANDLAVRELVRALHRTDPDHLVVSGDVTHRGRATEMRTFESLFAPWLERGTITVVPGNHDRVGEDAGRALMAGDRVRVQGREGLFLVQVDSTGAHNNSYFRSDGAMCEQVLAHIDAALTQAPQGVLVALVLHHHVLPLPEETFGERLAALVGLPHAEELPLSANLLELAHGRCDLLLHGHRHVPRAFHFDAGPRQLSVYNAGASPELGRFRLFLHDGGTLLGRPRWAPGRLSAPLHPAPAALPLPA